jgi:glycosyltransferase involved in cell wall biosynthesis
MSRKINPRVKAHTEQKDRMRKKLAVKKGPKKICLVMIVRNESKNMKRILKSLEDIIDMGSIVDTGSSDNTEEVIMEWSKKHNIPFTVHHEPFKNFSYNRTHSFQMAQKTYPEADYALLSDADFVWENYDFNKTLLVDHKYLIDQYNKVLTYANVRLLNMKINFVCKAVTHEFWVEDKDQGEYMGEVRTTKITTLIIDDKEDGGHKADKFERDERLLRQGLDDPKETKDLKTRYKFYLGQTLKDVGKYEESISWYNERIKDKGWAEEIYYAKFQIGYNYEQIAWKTRNCVLAIVKKEKTEEDINLLKKYNPNNLSISELTNKVIESFDKANESYLSAHKFRKSRVESLYYLTRMFRVMGKNEDAYKIAQIGKRIPYPKDDSLFIERNCYDYMFDFELSIVCNYIPDKREEGKKSILKLSERNDLPEYIKNTVTHNLQFY